MKQLLFIAACGVFFACNQQGSNGTFATDTIKQDNTLIKDTVAALPDTIVPVISNAPIGIYQGSIQKNGAPVQHTVAFYPNHTYRIQEVENGKMITNAKGKFTTNNIQLQTANNINYLWKDRVLMLVQNGRQNPLQKMMSARDNKPWAAKEKEGIVFYGVGNEPFWNVSVHAQKGIDFHLADWKEPVHFLPAKPIENADSIVYRTGNDSAKLQVVIYPLFCSDGMSDYTYDQQVKVIYNRKVFNGCGIMFGN